MAKAVVDASVARASGKREVISSQRCAECLILFQIAQHELVLSPQLSKEWNENAGKFAIRWLADMQSRRRVVRLGDCSCKPVYMKCSRYKCNAEQRRNWQKDFHLICAARMTEKVVLSLDDSARDLFSAMASQVDDLKTIEWINPAAEASEFKEWCGRKNRQLRKYTLDS